MKFTIIQVCNELICLTPVETVKVKASGTSTSSKAFFSAQNTQTIFSDTLVFELPAELKEKALSGGDKFVEFVLDSARKADITLTEIVIVPENQSIATKEYQHVPTKQKSLNSLAVLETESIISEETSNYSILNYEYGVPYGRTRSNAERTSALYAMPLSVIRSLKESFDKRGVKITKIIPQNASMVCGATNVIPSVNKVVAVLSIDLIAVRVTVIKNGGIEYSQCFESPLPEIADRIASEKGVSYIDAVHYLEENGVLNFLQETDVSAKNSRAVQNLLDYATGEIIRNIRMMLVSRKLEIDKICLCDHYAMMPNMTKYLRQFGFLMPIEDVGAVYTPENIPIVTDKATEYGFRASSYYTLSNIVTLCQNNKCNFLNGINSDKNKNSNIGKYATIAFGIVTALSMIGVGVLYGGLHVVKNIAEATLVDPKYDNVKQVMADEVEYSAKIKNVEKDKQYLPTYTDELYEVVGETFKQVTKKVKFVNNYAFDNTSNRIALNFDVEDFHSYVKLKDELNNNEYFKVLIPLTFTKDYESDFGVCTVTIKVDEEKLAERKAEEAKQEPETELTTLTPGGVKQ